MSERYALSANLYLDELDCHDGTPVPVSKIGQCEEFARGTWQPIRDKWKAPILQTSGYRTLTWNRAVGGAKSSTHLFEGDDVGLDIRPVYLSDVTRLAQLILAMWKGKELPALGGVGIYRGWIHIDNRKAPDGHLRRWNGRGIGGEQ